MREPTFCAAVARTGGGKTYENICEILRVHLGNPAKSVPPRKVLIIDNNMEYRDDNKDVLKILAPYRIHIKTISYRQVPQFTNQRQIEVCRIVPVDDSGRLMKGKAFGEALNFALENFKSGLIVAEDFKAMTGDHLNDELISSLVTRRHADCDTLVSLQGLRMIQPKVMNVLKWIRLHKVTGFIKANDEKFDSYIPMISIAGNIIDEKYKLGGVNKYFFLKLDLENYIIRGNYQPRDFDEAVQKYMFENWGQTAGRKLQWRDVTTGKKKFNDQTAIQETLKEYTNQYSQYSPWHRK